MEDAGRVWSVRICSKGLARLRQPERERSFAIRRPKRELVDEFQTAVQPHRISAEHILGNLFDAARRRPVDRPNASAEELDA